MTSPAALGSLAFLLAATPALGQRHARLTSRIDSLAKDVLRRSAAQGLSLAVGRGNETMVARGYGVARVADSTPATARTGYPIASITKQFTAAAILKLAEEKRLKLTDPAAKYLPGYTVAEDPVTIKHLLTHTSGWAPMPMLDGATVSDVPVDPDRVADYFRTAPVPFNPGERFGYSNSGYYLLGTIVERVSGQTYRDYLRDSLLTPLGLGATDECTADDDSAVPFPGFSAGGLCSNAEDLVAWARALGNRKVINNFSWHQMIEPVELKDGSTASYGFGVTLGRLGRHSSIGHGGSSPGFSSHLSYYPNDDVAVVVLASSGDALTRRLADQIARLVLGVVEPEVKDVELPPGQETRFEGSYLLQGDSTRISVRFQLGRLEAMLGEGKPFRLLYQGGNEFVSESDPATRLFFRVQGGKAGAVEFRVGDLMLVVPRQAELP